MPTATPHHEAQVASTVKSIERMYKRDMRASFIIAGVSAMLAVAITWFLIITGHVSAYASTILIIFAVVFALVSLISLFDAGRFFEIKSSAPKLWEMDREHEQLRKDFAEFINKSTEPFAIFSTGYLDLDLILFIKVRAPALLVEYKEWKEANSPPRAVKDKKEK